LEAAELRGGSRDQVVAAQKFNQAHQGEIHVTATYQGTYDDTLAKHGVLAHAHGYFPVDRKALNDPTDQAWVAQYPHFQTAIDQLHATKLDKATQGCLLGVMPAARQAAAVGIENAILKKSTPQKAMDDAVQSIQPQIDQYNQAVGTK